MGDKIMDTDQVKKVSTFKSGNFIFSRQRQDPEIETLHVWGLVLYKTVSDLPILPAWSSQLEETLIRRSIFGTAALDRWQSWWYLFLGRNKNERWGNSKILGQSSQARQDRASDDQ